MSHADRLPTLSYEPDSVGVVAGRIMSCPSLEMEVPGTEIVTFPPSEAKETSCPATTSTDVVATGSGSGTGLSPSLPERLHAVTRSEVTTARATESLVRCRTRWRSDGGLLPEVRHIPSTLSASPS